MAAIEALEIPTLVANVIGHGVLLIAWHAGHVITTPGADISGRLGIFCAGRPSSRIGATVSALVSGSS